MMTCRQVRPILSFLIEKEASPREALEARRHIDDCRSCSDRERDLRHVMGSVGTAPPAAMPYDVAPLIMDRLRSMKDRLSAQGTAQLAARWTGLCLVLAACLFAMSASYRQSFSAGLDIIPPLAELVNGESVAETAESVVTYAAPIAMRAASGTLGADVELEPASDLSIIMSILATALVILLMLAIPVTVTAVWIVRRSGQRQPLTSHPE